ncbi:uncharacterized protein [Primulina huaijiensis]|uniref:uncharacterized protein n=1 Tax=Primulina huaijiensis TaxID=1492673 RepID=UPI003CC6F51D
MKKKKTIDSFFKQKEQISASQDHSPSNIDVSNPSDQHLNKSPRIDVDVSSLEPDPTLRTPIWKYHVNQMDEIRRAYIKMGPYQPIKKEYPPNKFGSQNRRFQSHLLEKYTKLEYSPSKDAAFCFSCFLFGHKHPHNLAFTIDGFKYWKRVNDGDRCTFFMHIGCNTSPHNNAVQYLDNLMNIPRHIDKVINAQSSEETQKNRLRLTATIESIRWLTLQACTFKGHDESPSSNYRGNFIEMINFIGKINKSIGDIILEKAPKNAKYTSPDIQKVS